VACPSDAASGATCTALTVSCPKLADLDVTLAVSEPTSPVSGTIYLHDNVGGAAFMDAGFVAAYLSHGLRVVQIKWQTDWQTSDVGVKHAACRFATLLSWTFANVHRSDRTKGFCAQSWGGGSGGLALALTHYGAGDFVDAVTITAGPPFARIDVGCDPSSAPLYVCPEIPSASPSYSDGVLGHISQWEAAPACATPNPPPAEVTRWQSDSVLSAGAVLSFPHTSFAAWYCVNGVDSTLGQGALFFNALTATADETTIHCVAGGAAGGTCSGQAPWPSATPDMADDLAKRCVARH
jgi:hypothetical protein